MANNSLGDSGMKSKPPILRIEQLYLEFSTYEGTAQVLNGVDLQINDGDILGLVGESGCGKTVTALTITGLIRTPPARIVSGNVVFQGRDLLTLPKDEMRRIRSREIAMVFQDPISNLNPLLTIGEQVTDAVLCRRGLSSALRLSPLGALIPSFREDRRSAKARGVNLFDKVGIPDALDRWDSYPFQFSGGMKQRTLIAMALGGEPQLLIADEPTTDLDVSIQSQVLRLVRDLVREMGLSVLWVTHNLGVVAKLCNKVAVMYAGNVVEDGPTGSVFRQPKHPYTVGLLQATPHRTRTDGRLFTIVGSVPSLYDPPAGCRFHTRCSEAMPICRQEPFPPTVSISSDHHVACHLYSDPT
jgi:oligopeptide/dipeptide ABC transporter ATP-binding protein